MTKQQLKNLIKEVLSEMPLKPRIVPESLVRQIVAGNPPKIASGKRIMPEDGKTYLAIDSTINLSNSRRVKKLANFYGSGRDFKLFLAGQYQNISHGSKFNESNNPLKVYNVLKTLSVPLAETNAYNNEYEKQLKSFQNPCIVLDKELNIVCGGTGEFCIGELQSILQSQNVPSNTIFYALEVQSTK